MYAHRSPWVLPIAFFALIDGCAGAVGRSTSGQVNTLPASLAADVTGVWQGKSFADCPINAISSRGRCGAMQLITLTMFQDGLRIRGSYRCAYGNENCRDMAETGVISNGQMTARLLRIVVMLEDGSMCRFTGIPHDGILEGRYQCHWGGPIEQGGFHVERSY